MASITIRNLDNDIKRRLCARAAELGRSTEEVVRDILHQVVGQPSATRNFGKAIHARFAALDGFDLPQPNRQAMLPKCKLVTDGESHILS